MSVISKLLESEEGYRKGPYYCSEGFVTIGIGKRIGPKNADLSLYEFEVSKAVANEWLQDEINDLIVTLTGKFKWFSKLNEARQAIIISMCYQLGIVGFSKFKMTIYHIECGNFSVAGVEMMDSLWARQTPSRAIRHSKVMRTGELSPSYNFK